MVVFKELWAKHPSHSSDKNPCSTDGRPNFSDQCAIRLGVALAACEVDTRKLPGVRHCWHHDKAHGHVLGAEELAKALRRATVAGIKPVKVFSGADFLDAVRGRTGIIFFKDYWERAGESARNRSGDHIDLWNGTRLTDWYSWLRVRSRWFSSFSRTSPYQNAREVWFWRIL